MEQRQITTAKTNSLEALIESLPPQSLLMQLLPNRELNVMEFVSAQSGLTVLKALAAPQISRLNRDSPKEVAFTIGRLLEFVKKLFNLPENKNLNDVQIALLASDIKQRYWFLKFDELVYVFREGVAGKWGKNYQRLDAEIIHLWLQTYISTERDAVLENVVTNEAVAFKKQEAAATDVVIPMPDHIREQLQQLRHKLEKEAQEPDKRPVIVPVATQESHMERYKALLPELTSEELQTELKQAELKQNAELTALIETELTNRNKPAA